ncbi:ThiF family adenylyltransferase, partial [Staphylococcus epidermidis]|uniref:ThiF family adenylyltransferase n=1 Tax=Staphylococcus epidermidis TaxID=1282 RepID=UPI001642E431
MNCKVIKYSGDFKEKGYWERIKGNLGWLGESDEEGKKGEKKISEVVIGIGGCGGIGGGVGERVVGLGVGDIKVGDGDDFEVCNINREFGGCLDNVGRNKG